MNNVIQGFTIYGQLSAPSNELAENVKLSTIGGKLTWTGTMGKELGPFNKLLEVLAPIGWKIEVPHFIDHDGIHIHVQDTEGDVLYQALRNAWAQKISWELARRKT